MCQKYLKVIINLYDTTFLLFLIVVRNSFNPINIGWGYPMFIRQDELEDPSNGHLVKGTCTIEVFLCISSSSDICRPMSPTF
jgi:hypothetical protein